MRIIHQNLKKGEIKIKVDSPEDLWYLSHMIDANDTISGKTIRKIKKSGSDERTANVTRVPVFMSIKAEKIEINETADALRITGTILEGPEDIPHGSHHTFNVELNSEISISKEEWLKYQLDKLKDASQEKRSKILIMIFDREEAYFGLMKSYNYEILAHIAGNVSKKADISRTESTFYRDLIKIMKEYADRYEVNHIILASPSFWKEELFKELKDDSLRSKIIQATCSSVDKNAFNEVIKRDEVKQALAEERVSSEIRSVELLLGEVSKRGAATYGLEQVSQSVNLGAVKELLVSTSLITKKRQDDSYQELDSLMRSVEKMNGSVTIINSDHDGGKRLDGLGGIGAILRYKLEY